MINIVSNSIKYTKSGTIKISYEEFKHHVKFVIADTGHGISAEDQKRLFNPFIRVGSADDDSTTVGSGLGMWITKKLVEQLDGTISLESIKGVGTHVIIKLKKHEET